MPPPFPGVPPQDIGVAPPSADDEIPITGVDEMEGFPPPQYDDEPPAAPPPLAQGDALPLDEMRFPPDGELPSDDYIEPSEESAQGMSPPPMMPMQEAGEGGFDDMAGMESGAGESMDQGFAEPPHLQEAEDPLDVDKMAEALRQQEEDSDGPPPPPASGPPPVPARGTRDAPRILVWALFRALFRKQNKGVTVSFQGSAAEA